MDGDGDVRCSEPNKIGNSGNRDDFFSHPAVLSC